MGINERQQQIIDEFSAMADDDEGKDERWHRLIAYGAGLPPMPEEWKTERNRIKECASVVWLHAVLEDGHVKLFADGVPEAKVSKGLIALLLHVYNGATPQEILDTSPDFINRLGLSGRLLSMNRANGLAAMVKQIKMYAAVFQAMQKSGQ